MKPVKPIEHLAGQPLGTNQGALPSSLLPGQASPKNPLAPNDDVREYLKGNGFSDQERKISSEQADPTTHGMRNRSTADPVARIPAGLTHRRR
ncbi:hypothetical protein [Bradyrhizobium genosp. P]|uniref:hypothetical protein n=1 Tax=Bradyrhizobium genosp. P TaxID=83641 RepID=UPI003CE97737